MVETGMEKQEIHTCAHTVWPCKPNKVSLRRSKVGKKDSLTKGGVFSSTVFQTGLTVAAQQTIYWGTEEYIHAFLRAQCS